MRGFGGRGRQGDKVTRGQGDKGDKGDKGTRGQGDKGTRERGEMNCPYSPFPFCEFRWRSLRSAHTPNSELRIPNSEFRTPNSLPIRSSKDAILPEVA